MVASCRSVALLAGLALAGCATSDPDEVGRAESIVVVSTEQQPTDSGSAAVERRVTIEQLSDPTIELDLSEYTGLDLEDAAPPAGEGFCDAVAGAPSRWLNDSIVPLQYWFDSYGGVGDAPPVAAEAIASLLSYGRERIDWNLGSAQRPQFNSGLAAHAKTVADAAVATCPDLPAVLGRSESFLADPWGGAVGSAEVASRCADDRAEIEAAISRYEELFASAPLHLEQIETGLLVHDEYFFGSDLHGISVDNSDLSVPFPVEGGPCSNDE